MSSPETRVQIRRYFYAEHWKIGTIAQALNVHVSCRIICEYKLTAQKYLRTGQRYLRMAYGQETRRIL